MFLYVSAADVIPGEMEGDDLVRKIVAFVSGIVLMISNFLVEMASHEHEA